MRIQEIKAKSIFIKSGLSDADWVINPYIGCQFGCKYCYAAFMGRWKHPTEEWGEFLDVKINASEVLKKELERLEEKHKTKNFGSILFSSVTDPYTGLEAKYEITRKCLETLVDFGYKGEVSILTKSPLVVRDIDLLKKLNSEVGLTVTGVDDEVVRFFESFAPPISARIKALKELDNNGIPVYAFVGPLLPYFTARKDKLRDLFLKLKESGVREIYIENINLSSEIKERLFKYLVKENPGLIPYFEKAERREYKLELERMIFPLLKEVGLKLTIGRIIYHSKS